MLPKLCAYLKYLISQPLFPNIFPNNNLKAPLQGGTHKISVCLARRKKNLSISCSDPMARLFEKSPRHYPSPIVGINKHPQKTGLIPPAPKIDYPNFTNIETCPKRLNYWYVKSFDNPIDERNSKLSDRNSNLQLLPAKTSLTSNYKISFIKTPFTIKFHS